MENGNAFKSILVSKKLVLYTFQSTLSFVTNKIIDAAATKYSYLPLKAL